MRSHGHAFSSSGALLRSRRRASRVCAELMPPGMVSNLRLTGFPFQRRTTARTPAIPLKTTHSAISLTRPAPVHRGFGNTRIREIRERQPDHRAAAWSFFKTSMTRSGTLTSVRVQRHAAKGQRVPHTRTRTPRNISRCSSGADDREGTRSAEAGEIISRHRQR